MILPRIRNNLLNHSQINLQQDGIKELVCVADAFPEATVSWIRGCFALLGFFSDVLSILSFLQHRI